MIDGKQALQSALQNLFALVGERELANGDGIQLEELELTDDSKHNAETRIMPRRK